MQNNFGSTATDGVRFTLELLVGYLFFSFESGKFKYRRKPVILAMN
jgi:hypothetical protein